MKVGGAYLLSQVLPHAFFVAFLISLAVFFDFPCLDGCHVLAGQPSTEDKSAFEKAGEFISSAIRGAVPSGEPKVEAATHFSMGILYTLRSEYELAMEELNKARELDPDSAAILLKIGDVYIKQGKNDRAVRAINKSLEKDNSYEAHVMLARTYLQQSKTTDAIKEFEQAIKFNQPDLTPYVELGKLYSQENKLNEAIRVYTDALKINSKQEFLWYELGLLYFKAGSFSESEQSFRKSLQFNKRLLCASLGLAIVLETQGKLKEAVAEYKESKRLCPKCKNIDKKLDEIDKKLKEQHSVKSKPEKKKIKKEQ